MTKYCFRLLFFIFLPTLVCAQENDFQVDSGFVGDNTSRIFTDEEIKAYIFEPTDTAKNSIIGGSAISIFHERIDSIWITYIIDESKTDSIFSANGLFRIYLGNVKKDKLLDLKFRHPDYHFFDTTVIVKPLEHTILPVQMAPKFKISLRGRVYAGNLPLEGVKVNIREKEKSYLMETRGCFYDKENYWNCLYDGMFKQDLTLDNSQDSIYLSFERLGMKPLSYGMVLSDYTGDIMDVKMKYDSKLPVRSYNCFNLKIAFPFMTSNADWFIDLAYYRTFTKKFFDRISIGLDANMILSPISITDTTFLDNTGSFDTSYISGYIGPSMLFWLRRPENRYFSTYAGITAGIGLDDGAFFFQPFIGTRVFIDFNKAISIELRHASYDLDVVHYTFNPYGNAYRRKELEDFEDYLLDIGIHIVF
jgi:hypothetical protein